MRCPAKRREQEQDGEEDPELRGRWI